MVSFDKYLFFFITFRFLLGAAIFAQDNQIQDQNSFPQDISRMYQLKIGYSNDRLLEESFMFGSVKADIRLNPVEVAFMDIEYIQIQFPVSFYYFNPENKNSYAFDIRLRPELGPPANNRIPLFFPELGYLHLNKKWFVDNEQKNLNALLIGGMVRFPVKARHSAVVEVNGQISITGESFTRYSCYMHWFVSEHFGFTIHGDVFPSHRLFEGETTGYGAMLFGVVFK